MVRAVGVSIIRTRLSHSPDRKKELISETTKSSADGRCARVQGSHAINESAFDYYSSLQKIRQHVEGHHSEDIRLKTAARIAGMETKYFSAFFHKKLGITYSRWLTSLRITKAMALIKATDAPLMHIGSTVGFRDLRTFERSFKRCTNMTPWEFKKSIRPS